MSVAACLGVDDMDGVAMTASRRAWPGWCEHDPQLRVVDDLLDLRSWTRQASRDQANAVLVRLARLAADDTDAANVLAWLLVPGAARLANELRDLSADIDALVAGQLWLEIHNHATTTSTAIAAAILENVRRTVLGEFGKGEGAKRHDEMSMHTTVTGRIDELGLSLTPDEFRPDGDTVLLRLIKRMIADGMLTLREATYVHCATGYADWIGIPDRENGGITAAASVDFLAMITSKSERTMRRRITAIMTKMVDYAQQHVDFDDVLWRPTGDDEDTSVGEFLITAVKPHMAAVRKNWRNHYILTARCPHLGLFDEATTEDHCGCARLKVGCLIKQSTPDNAASSPGRY